MDIDRLKRLAGMLTEYAPALGGPSGVDTIKRPGGSDLDPPADGDRGRGGQSPNGIQFDSDDGVMSHADPVKVIVGDSNNSPAEENVVYVDAKDINVNGSRSEALEEMKELLSYAKEDGCDPELYQEAKLLIKWLFKKKGKFFTASMDDTIWVWVSE